MSDITPIDVFNNVYPYIIGYVGGHGGAILLAKVQNAVHATRKLVDTMDDAMTNKNITEEQAQATWQIIKPLLKR